MTTAAIIVGLLIVALYVSARRTGGVEAWCRTRGFDYLGKVPPELQAKHAPFTEIVGGGRVYNWGAGLSGHWEGHRVLLFEHEWATGVGDSQRRAWHTFVIWEVENGNLPRFGLTRQPPAVLQPVAAVADALTGIVSSGSRDRASMVGFPDDEEFGRRFRAHGEPAGIRALLQPHIRASLCAEPPEGGVVAAGRLIVWQAPGLLSAGKMDELLAKAVRVRQIFGV